MNKIIFRVLSFVFLILSGVLGLNFSNTSFSSSAENGAVMEVQTPQTFVELFKDDNTDGNGIYNNPNITIKLTGPLDFDGIDLSEISKDKKTFMGTLDGNGQTISNLTLTSSCLYYGLIPYAKNATIKNLRIAGDVDFIFDETNNQDMYAGVLVGYGENVTIKNCELDAVDEIIDVSVSSNINFGFLAGKLKGNPNALDQFEPANITNCINYYDANIVLNKYTNISVGGLVGTVENCYMLSCMNYGDIQYSRLNTLTQENTGSQYFGGIAGTINGSGLKIRNNIFCGQITAIEGEATGINAYVGAIVGGAITSSIPTANVNFDYYTQLSLAPCGDNYILKSEKVSAVDSVNKGFLTTAENFDQSIQSWDFDRIWILSNSKFCIQNFQMFEFDFNAILDRNKIIESAQFFIDGKEVGTAPLIEPLKVAHNTSIDIVIKIKEEYQGYYQLSDVLRNNNQFNWVPTTQDNKHEDGNTIVGYTISVIANATTSGTYSFVISHITYDCIISISDDAKTNSQGGVRVYSTGNNSTAIAEFEMTFAHNSGTKRVVAEGRDIYNFSKWELYYKDENGEFSGTPVELNDNPLSITFGTAPFNKEFKLIAYFTDENAIKVGFGQIDDELIKSIYLSGEVYSGQPIKMAPTRIARFEVVTIKDYILNVESISNSILELYGTAQSPYPPLAQTITTNQEGETTYVFQIDLNVAKDNITKNEITLQLEAIEDTSKNKNDMWWIYIVIAVVAVIIIGIVVFIVVRRRNGGGKSGKTKVQKKEKDKGYKDYYA